jgi:hypothetical protein
MKQKNAFLFAILAFCFFFFLPLIQKSPLVSFSLLEPYEVVPDSSVPLLEVTYEKIIPERVHGLLEIRNLNEEVITPTLICPITKGEVREKENSTYIECKYPESTLQLLSGTYFIQLEGHSPQRVVIHKGEKAIAEVN